MITHGLVFGCGLMVSVCLTTTTNYGRNPPTHVRTTAVFLLDSVGSQWIQVVSGLGVSFQVVAAPIPAGADSPRLGQHGSDPSERCELFGILFTLNDLVPISSNHANKYYHIPVVPHKAVAEVSKIGNL